jgi:hypothetical protein
MRGGGAPSQDPRWKCAKPNSSGRHHHCWYDYDRCTLVQFQAVRSLATPPTPSDPAWWGESPLTQKLAGSPFSQATENNCCDRVAMRAVSSDLQLKSLRAERPRRPLSRREIGERHSQREKRSRHRPGTGPQFARARFCLEILWFKSDTRNPSARRQNGRVRP